MKLTITIEGLDEDFSDDLKRQIENAISYGYCGDMPAPDMSCAYEEDDDQHKIEECCMCHVKYFAQELDEHGLCDDCAEEQD